MKCGTIKVSIRRGERFFFNFNFNKLCRISNPGPPLLTLIVNNASNQKIVAMETNKHETLLCLVGSNVVIEEVCVVSSKNHKDLRAISSFLGNKLSINNLPYNIYTFLPESVLP